MVRTKWFEKYRDLCGKKNKGDAGALGDPDLSLGDP